MILPLLLALSQPAPAASEVVVRTSTPILLYVNGRQARLTGKFSLRATDLPPGSAKITINGTRASYQRSFASYERSLIS